jgi:hypothetical protein
MFGPLQIMYICLEAIETGDKQILEKLYHFLAQDVVVTALHWRQGKGRAHLGTLGSYASDCSVGQTLD